MAGFGVRRFRRAAQRVNALGLPARCVVFVAAGAAKLVFCFRDLACGVIRRFGAVARSVLGFCCPAQQVIGGLFAQPGLTVFDLLPFGVVRPGFYRAIGVRGLRLLATSIRSPAAL